MATISFDQRPTGKFIDDLFTSLSNTWKAAHRDWEIRDTYYHRTYSLWTPEKEQTRGKYRPSTPTNVIDHAADTQLAFEPRVHREPVGDSQESKEAANRIELAMKAVLDSSSLMELMLPWKQMGRHLVHYGYTPADGPVLNLSDRPTKPKRKRGEDDDDFSLREDIFRAGQKNWNPVRIRSTHPARVLLDPLNKQPRYAVKNISIVAHELHEMSKQKASRGLLDARVFDLENIDPYSLVEIIEYWTRRWHAVKLKSGEILWTEPSPGGIVPFAHAYAGFGMEPTDLKKVDPKFMAAGLLGPIIDSIKNQAQSASAKHQLLIAAAYAPRGTPRDPSEMAQQLQQDLIQGEEGDLWTVKTKEITRWMFEVGREAATDIEQGTFSRALAGQREAGVNTVGQQAILSTAAQRKFAAAAVQLQHLASITAGNILRLVDLAIKRPIGAEGKELRPADIAHNYDIKVTFEVIDPLLELQRRQLGIQEVQTGLKDMETYWQEDARIEDVVGLRKRLMMDKIRNSPIVAAKFAQETAREMGLGGIVDEEMALAIVTDGESLEGGPGAGVENPMDERGNGAAPTTERQANRRLRNPVSPDTASPGDLLR
ncbi:hypothetical protein CMI37_20385 [Candidatus Pacearchaeota archaeon]|nr:hypothetical protein [Candidatus Pacearchaeota archaeon]|tara:strand:- start:6699 stop:8495 length:1797 start_codon:yes stop_codon:yes gene_type:complete